MLVHKLRVGLIATLVAATASISVPGAAVAEPPRPSQPAETIWQPTDDKSDPAAEAADRAAVAGEFSWQQEFTLISQEVREAFPDDFAEARIDPNQASGSISFEDDIPEGALEFTHRLTNIRLEPGLGYTETSLEAASLTLLNMVSESVGPDYRVSSYFDSADNSLHALFGGNSPDTLDAGAGIALSERLAATIGSLDARSHASVAVAKDLPVIIEFIADPIPESSEAGWLAGHALFYRGVEDCSTAFPVKKIGGAEIGILTAGHCGNGPYFTATNNILSVLPFSLATTTTYPGGDMRWLRSSQMFSGQTFVNTGDLRTFGTSAIAPFNSTACKFGIKSGPGCGTITVSGNYELSTVKPEDGGGTYTVGPLRGVGTHITKRGDSGGPWYFANTAYGIHFGTNMAGTVSVFSHVGNALTRFGLQLWTG